MAEYAQNTTETTGSTSADEDYKSKVDDATQASVKNWCAKITAARKYWEDKTFKEMRENMQLARDGAPKAWVDGDAYVVPIINRHINQSVSQLYARNPKILAKRKQRMMHTVWDGKMKSLIESSQSVMGATQAAVGATSVGMQPMPPDPNAVAILEDAMKVQQYNDLMDRICETLTLVQNHYLNEKASQYKQQLKSLVRRTKVCSVGYVKLGFQRMLEPSPDVTAKVADATEQIQRIERLMAEQGRGEIAEDSAKIEELRRMIADLQAQPMIPVKEGPIWTFPPATRIIIDPAVMHLKTLTGAGWVAEEYAMTPAKIEEVYKKDVRSDYKKYQNDGDKEKLHAQDGDQKCEDPALVWRVMSRDMGLEFTICDGYCDWLKPPAAPDVQISRFFDIFPLVFNETEMEDGNVFPPSDVKQSKHIQLEYNRSRQGLREHRQQNKPGFATSGSALSETDKAKFMNRVSGEIVEVAQLGTGEKIADKLMPIPVNPIDPALYDVEPLFMDLLRSVGSSQANLGPTAGDTATESSIAEQSRSISTSDHVDDLDDFLSLLSDATGELCLRQLSKETVVRIVGPGAVWPVDPQTRDDIIEDISVDIKAGSSGRPNRAAELANMERGMPFLIQLPGVNPTPVGEKYLDLLEIDAEGVVVEGLPSIVAMNAIASKPPPAPGETGTGGAQQQPGTGDGSDPKDQGAEGADNAPAAGENEPQSQPAFPSPAPGFAG